VDYVVRINSGESALASAQAAFGDLKLLNKALKTYMNQPNLSALKLSAEKISSNPSQFAN
jgi:hypothetical protein